MSVDYRRPNAQVEQILVNETPNISGVNLNPCVIGPAFQIYDNVDVSDYYNEEFAFAMPGVAMIPDKDAEIFGLAIDINSFYIYLADNKPYGTFDNVYLLPNEHYDAGTFTVDAVITLFENLLPQNEETQTLNLVGGKYHITHSLGRKPALPKGSVIKIKTSTTAGDINKELKIEDVDAAKYICEPKVTGETFTNSADIDYDVNTAVTNWRNSSGKNGPDVRVYFKGVRKDLNEIFIEKTSIAEIASFFGVPKSFDEAGNGVIDVTKEIESQYVGWNTPENPLPFHMCEMKIPGSNKIVSGIAVSCTEGLSTNDVGLRNPVISFTETNYRAALAFAETKEIWGLTYCFPQILASKNISVAPVVYPELTYGEEGNIVTDNFAPLGLTNVQFFKPKGTIGFDLLEGGVITITGDYDTGAKRYEDKTDLPTGNQFVLGEWVTGVGYLLCKLSGGAATAVEAPLSDTDSVSFTINYEAYNKFEKTQESDETLSTDQAVKVIKYNAIKDESPVPTIKDSVYLLNAEYVDPSLIFTLNLAFRDHVYIQSKKENRHERSFTGLNPKMDFALGGTLENANAVKEYAMSLRNYNDGDRRVFVIPQPLVFNLTTENENEIGRYVSSTAYCCALIGADSEEEPQQPFTNRSFGTSLGVVGTAPQYFKEDYMDIIASGGNLCLYYPAIDGPVFVRHQLSIDRSSVVRAERSCLKQFDFFSKINRKNFDPNMGKYNIDDNFMFLLNTLAQAIIKREVDAKHIKDAKVLLLQQVGDTDFIDYKVRVFTWKPGNYLDIVIYGS